MANTPRRQRPGAGPPTRQEFEALADTLDLLIDISQRPVMLSGQGAVDTIHRAGHAGAKARRPARRDDFASRADRLEADVEALPGAPGTLGGTLGGALGTASGAMGSVSSALGSASGAMGAASGAMGNNAA